MTQSEYVNSVKDNSQRLFLIALSYTKNQADAENILQNTFLKLWKHTDELTDEEHIKKWLTRVCVNECKNYVTSPFRKRVVSYEECKEAYSLGSEKDYDLLCAVQSLPKKERAVIHLFYYEDLPVKEIAELLGTTVNNVTTRLSRARNKLKEKLGDDWLNE